jgi:hypothetical protein
MLAMSHAHLSAPAKFRRSDRVPAALGGYARFVYRLKCSGSAQPTIEQFACWRQWLPVGSRPPLIVDLRLEDHEVSGARDDRPEDLLCKELGLEYLHLPIANHAVPPLDWEHLVRVQVLTRHNRGAWIHFHCQGGKARTTMAMTVLHMLVHPEAPLPIIAACQVGLGGKDLFRVRKPAAGEPAADERGRYLHSAYRRLARGVTPSDNPTTRAASL